MVRTQPSPDFGPRCRTRLLGQALGRISTSALAALASHISYIDILVLLILHRRILYILDTNVILIKRQVPNNILKYNFTSTSIAIEKEELV